MKQVIFTYLLLISAYCCAQKSFDKDLGVATHYFELKEYANAIFYYDRCYQVKPKPEIAAQIAMAYSLIRDYKKAEIWFRIVVKKYPCEKYLLEYAEVLRINGKTEQAITTLTKYIGCFGDDHAAVELLERWKEVASWNNDENHFKLNNLARLNSAYSDICAVRHAGGIVFSSSRPGVLIKEKYGRTNGPYYNLYYSEKRNGKWNRPGSFSSMINTLNHEGACTFNSNNDTIYFSRSKRASKNNVNEVLVNPVQLYQSHKTSIGWDKVQLFVFNDTLKSYAHPSISGDGNTLFFCSNREGGFGGMDIYMCIRKRGLWSDPINLGPGINTAGDECYPYFHPSGMLYFSSDGHAGYGGLDVFKVDLAGQAMGEVINLRRPINSSGDDFGFSFNEDKSEGYLTSNRPGGKGMEDVYLVQDQ